MQKLKMEFPRRNRQLSKSSKFQRIRNLKPYKHPNRIRICWGGISVPNSHSRAGKEKSLCVFSFWGLQWFPISEVEKVGTFDHFLIHFVCVFNLNYFQPFDFLIYSLQSNIMSSPDAARLAYAAVVEKCTTGTSALIYLYVCPFTLTHSLTHSLIGSLIVLSIYYRNWDLCSNEAVLCRW
jgi:hypothetical protein